MCSHCLHIFGWVTGVYLCLAIGHQWFQSFLWGKFQRPHNSTYETYNLRNLWWFLDVYGRNIPTFLFFGWEILLSEKRGFDSLTSQCPLWTAGLTLFMDRWYRGSIVQFNRKNNHVCMNIDVVNHICSFLKSQSKCAPHFQTHPFMGSGLIWSRHHVVTSLECVWETIPKW